MTFRDKSQNILGNYSKITVKVGKFNSSARRNCMIALMLNDIILSLIYNQFIFRLWVERKCNLFVMSFIEYIHWKSPAQILVAFLNVSTIIFKTITIFLVSTTKLRTRLALSLLSTSDHTFSKEKNRIFAHSWKAGDWGSQAEWSLALESRGLTPAPLPSQGGTPFEGSNSLQPIAMSSMFQIQISKFFAKDYHYLHFTYRKQKHLGRRYSLRMRTGEEASPS